MNSHLSFTTFTFLLFVFLSIACSSTDDPTTDGDFDKIDTEQELDENYVVDGDESETSENTEKDTITDGDLEMDILSEQDLQTDGDAEIEIEIEMEIETEKEIEAEMETDVVSEQEVIVDCNQVRGEHHKSGRQDPVTSCFGCHSSSFCSNCHSNNDHPTNYGGKMHNSGNCCQWCHGPSRTGGIGPACSTCH